MAARIGTFLAAVVLLLLVATPARAHGGATVTIHSDGHGSVWITAQWQDGHPINEPTTVTLTASGGSQSPVAPSVLRQTGDERGTQTYGGTLAPGSWHVAIDLGAPVTGHCQALIPAADPASTPTPTEVACLIPATAASPGPAPATAGGSLTPLWITLGALLVAGAAAAVVAQRRKRP